jgi:haloalkane dehalogenase
VTDAIRTPDVLLDGLDGFDWAPALREWDGLRLAHADLGDARPS